MTDYCPKCGNTLCVCVEHEADELNWTFKHYQGGSYRVICHALDHETEQELVVYSSVLHPEVVWVRTLHAFQEVVEWPDGQRRSRFQAS